MAETRVVFYMGEEGVEWGNWTAAYVSSAFLMVLAPNPAGNGASQGLPSPVFAWSTRATVCRCEFREKMLETSCSTVGAEGGRRVENQIKARGGRYDG